MTTPAFILRLMAYRPVHERGRFRLRDEDRECIAFASELRVATVEGRLGAVWTHPPNQLAGQGATKAVARAMGLIPGASDYWFVWHGGGCLIEFKTDDGKQDQAQKDFEAWSSAIGVPYYLVRSAKAALQILRDHGRLK